MTAIARSTLVAALLLMFGLPAPAQEPSLSGRAEMSMPTRLMVIRALNAELVFVRRPFPSGHEGYTIQPGKPIAPDDQKLSMILAQRGPVARPGDRVAITNVEFKGDSIIFEINGGPRKKRKWWQRITIGGMGGAAQAPGPDPNVRGSNVILAFKGHIPEMTVEEIKQLLLPVFDFEARSAAESYIASLPEHVQEAIKDHRVLVGMDREMVTLARGRPWKKVRERDEQGIEFEEWLFGQPPEDVEFVRFVGDEVVQLKIMKVDGEKIVRTEREVDLAAIRRPTVAQGASPGGAEGADGTGADPAATPSGPKKPPTLRRPDEPVPAGQRRDSPSAPLPPPAGAPNPDNLPMPNPTPAPGSPTP